MIRITADWRRAELNVVIDFTVRCLAAMIRFSERINLRQYGSGHLGFCHGYFLWCDMNITLRFWGGHVLNISAR